jgi:hypothetical protein
MFTNTVLAATQFRAYAALRGTTEDHSTERARAARDWAAHARTTMRTTMRTTIRTTQALLPVHVFFEYRYFEVLS